MPNLVIRGPVAARHLQQHASRLFSERATRFPTRAGRADHPDVDRARRLMQKATEAHRQFRAQGDIPEFRIFLPDDQMPLATLLIEHVRDSPRARAELAPALIDDVYVFESVNHDKAHGLVLVH